MPAVRTKKEAGRFVSLDKTVLHDSRLSLQAKGLHSYMMSMPDDWVFYETELQKHFTNGRDSIRKTMRELQEFGYLVKRQSKNSDGTFGVAEMWLYETPQSTVDWKTVDGKPADGLSADGKPDTTNNDLTNNHLTKNDEPNIKPIGQQVDPDLFDLIWKSYPKKIDKKKAFASYTRAIKKGISHQSIAEGLANYLRYLEINKSWLKPQDGGRWFEKERWMDEYDLNATSRASTGTPDYSQYDPTYGKDLGF